MTMTKRNRKRRRAVGNVGMFFCKCGFHTDRKTSLYAHMVCYTDKEHYEISDEEWSEMYDNPLNRVNGD